MKIIKPFITILIVFCITITGCKQKDADIKTAVEKSLSGAPLLTGIGVEVKDAVVTLSGQLPDETAKSLATTAAQSVKGVKSVINQTTIHQVSLPVIALDDVLVKNVNDAVKDYPTVVANVKDGIISLQGSIEKAKLPKLLMSISALKPKKIENKLTIK